MIAVKAKAKSTFEQDVFSTPSGDRLLGVKRFYVDLEVKFVSSGDMTFLEKMSKRGRNAWISAAFFEHLKEVTISP